MIRFIRIGDQIQEGENAFAFFDTVTDRFMNLNGAEYFDSIAEFLLFCPAELQTRLIGLIPKNFK